MFFMDMSAITWVDRLALLLIIIGGLNWGLIGLFQFDLVAFLFGSAAALLARAVYVLVGISALVSIPMLFTENTD